MHKSVWKKTHLPNFPAVSKEASYDVIVVGGGITGLSTAYSLTEAGKKVCLLEKNRLGAGATGSTTAHLTAVTDLRLFDLAESFGDQNATLVWRAGEEAINRIENTVNKLQIDCDFKRVDGFLHASLECSLPLEEEVKKLQMDLEVANRLNINAVYEPKVPIVGRPGICFPDQAKMHPFRYLNGLIQSLVKSGCDIFEYSEVSKVEAEPLTVVSNGHHVTAEHLVIATNVPLMGKTGLLSAALFQTKIQPYSSYVIEGKIPKDKYLEASLWDTNDPYFYLRVDKGAENDFVIFGGRDHKTGQVAHTEERYFQLQDKLKGIMPEVEVIYQWSGQVIESPDGLPFIGEISKNQFIGTGFCGNGFTFGTLTGLMASDSILKKESLYQKLFHPNRKQIHGLWNYLKENVDYPVYLVKDYLEKPEHTSSQELEKGQGEVLEIEGKKVACYKDNKGTTHMLSATCTHMGCTVHWNSGEKTWDCPCHGSRFKTNGEVLAGPAESPLGKVKWAPPSRNVAEENAPLERAELN